jgi:hypothetical protein
MDQHLLFDPGGNMRRILLAMCFVGSIVQAQDVPVAPSQSPAIIQPESPKQAATQSGAEPGPVIVVPSGPQLLLRDGSPVKSLSAVPALVVTSYERHRQMRRDRDEEFVVLLCKPYGRWKTCPLWTPGGTDGVVPVSLELKDVDGLALRYREGKDYVSHPDGSPVHTARGLDVFRFTVRPDKDARLGATTLEGRLTYQRIQDGKLSAPETIDVTIPVMVVKHDTEVVESHWSIESPKHNPLAPLGNAVLYVIAAPILLPFLILQHSL